jgi:hypothetical protein
MQRYLIFVLSLALALAVSGCGRDEGLLRTKGRLLKGGQAFIPNEGEFIQVIFVPIRPDGKPPGDHYVADVDQTTATFVPDGKNRKGMPPGKYRVAVELMMKKDLLGGKFDAVNSPFVFDVDSGTKEIVIDLDKPPAV